MCDSWVYVLIVIKDGKIVECSVYDDMRTGLEVLHNLEIIHGLGNVIMCGRIVKNLDLKIDCNTPFEEVGDNTNSWEHGTT